MAELSFAVILIFLIIIFGNAVDRSRRAGDGTKELLPISDSDNDIPFESTAGWIWIRQGSADQVKAAIVDYTRLFTPQKPQTFRAELHRQADGTLAVLFPDGLPAHDLVNLTGWLNSSPDQKGPHNAVLWLTSCGDGTRYFFREKPENQGNDTLIGADEWGQGVHVYLPDNTLWTVTDAIAFEQEPEIERDCCPEVLELSFDVNTTFGNPSFEIADRG